MYNMYFNYRIILVCSAMSEITNLLISLTNNFDIEIFNKIGFWSGGK